MQCDLIYGFLKCDLQEDIIDVDLTVQALKWIHTFEKDCKSQTSRFSLWQQKCNPIPPYDKRW